MASIEDLLHRGETLRLRARPHSVIFLRPGAWLAIAAALFVLAPLSANVRLWTIAGALFAGAALVAAVEAAVRRSTTELVVTDRRVLLQTGLWGSIREVFGPGLSVVQIDRDALSDCLGYAWFRIPSLGRQAPRLALGEPDLLRAAIEELALGRQDTVAVEPGPAKVGSAAKAAAIAASKRSAARTPRMAAATPVDAEPRRKTNGDARPTLDGDGRVCLRPQPALDRI